MTCVWIYESLEDQFDHVARKAITSEMLPDNPHARNLVERLREGGWLPWLSKIRFDLFFKR